MNNTIESTCPDRYKEFAKNIRNGYLPLKYEKSFYYDCKKDETVNTYLYFMIKMNDEIEKRNQLFSNILWASGLWFLRLDYL